MMFFGPTIQKDNYSDNSSSNFAGTNNNSTNILANPQPKTFQLFSDRRELPEPNVAARLPPPQQVNPNINQLQLLFLDQSKQLQSLFTKQYQDLERFLLDNSHQQQSLFNSSQRPLPFAVLNGMSCQLQSLYASQTQQLQMLFATQTRQMKSILFDSESKLLSSQLLFQLSSYQPRLFDCFGQPVVSENNNVPLNEIREPFPDSFEEMRAKEYFSNKASLKETAPQENKKEPSQKDNEEKTETNDNEVVARTQDNAPSLFNNTYFK